MNKVYQDAKEEYSLDNEYEFFKLYLEDIAESNINNVNDYIDVTDILQDDFLGYLVAGARTDMYNGTKLNDFLLNSFDYYISTGLIKIINEKFFIQVPKLLTEYSNYKENSKNVSKKYIK